ncbi:hypothetical protein GCM10009716_31650 [Streptomyces sodiiphilus]|uniref:Uncharacterized protein n=1 Tax=Streptomyces sodiiphilus TaxID=226217 RepID=A0ABP5AR99_9ACTN
MRVVRWFCHHPGVSLVLALLILGGYTLVRPPLERWSLLSTACDGKLSRSALDAVRGDREVAEQRQTLEPDLGRYTCVLRDRNGNQIVEVVAMTRPDEVDRQLDADFLTLRPEPLLPSLRAGLPEGVPGVVLREGGMRILVRCPALGPGTDGQETRMLVMARTPHDVEDADAVPIAVELANASSTQLGCGAPPLPLPERPAESLGEWVPLGTATGTSCDVLASGVLPAPPPGGWVVKPAASVGAPATRCALGGARGDEHMVLAGWYGAWSEPTLAQITNQETWNRLPATGEGEPQITPYFGRASAVCLGQPAHFAVRVERDAPASLHVDTVRATLTAFAEEEVSRRGCEGLRLPGELITEPEPEP